MSKKKPRANVVHGMSCTVCAAPVKTDRWREGKYCCRRCMEAAETMVGWDPFVILKHDPTYRHMEPRPCFVCGVIFRSQHHKIATCGPVCGRKYQALRRKAKRYAGLSRANVWANWPWFDRDILAECRFDGGLTSDNPLVDPMSFQATPTVDLEVTRHETAGTEAILRSYGAGAAVQRLHLHGSDGIRVVRESHVPCGPQGVCARTVAHSL